jgi:CheY-like chemotaxis protein
MEIKLDWVLLVDDDKDCNFLHHRIISKMSCTRQIDVAYDGEEALQILKGKPLATLPASGIIFLDINMPGLNGWEFLDEYLKSSDLNLNAHIVIILLSSSLNPDDKEMALKYPCINGFLNKPLSEVAVHKVLDENFLQIFSEAIPAE